MNSHTLKNVTLIASIASCFTQIGAQLFAIVVIVRTIIAAPPRSFAMLQGDYGYDSNIFWQTVPMITLALLILAIVTNWRTTRRNLLLLSLALFLAGSAVAGIVVEPGLYKLMAAGYSSVVNASLQSQAATLYAYDWGLWIIALAAGITLLVALARPVTNR
jgi:hypothetical protein